MVKNILVTGGTGFLGSALVHRLIQENHKITVLDNCFRSSVKRLAGVISNINYIEGDIRDLQTVQNAARGIDCIIHLAAINGTENFYRYPELVLEVGVRGMLNILDACKTHKIGNLVVASSSEVYQSPPHVPTDESAPLSIPNVLNARYSYGGSKIITELLALHCAQEHMQRVTVFRPHNVYGPDMAWEHVIPQFIVRMVELCKQYPTGTMPFQLQGNGNQTRSFIYISDMIEGLMCILKQAPHKSIYHIGNPEEITIAELAHMIARQFKREINIVQNDLPQGSTLRRCPDISKLKQLGFMPKVSLEQGLPNVIKWYVANLHQGKLTHPV